MRGLDILLGALLGLSTSSIFILLHKYLSRRASTRALTESSKFQFTSKVCDGIPGAIGNSPLIYLRSLSEETGCHIFVPKYYFFFWPTMEKINLF